EEVLAAAIAADIPYIGLIASTRRGTAVVAGIEGGDRVHTPAGLDIGARTPPEIALSVFAEILSLRPRPRSRARDITTADTATGAVAIDPICGMEVAVVPATIRFKDEYFCGPG